MLQNDRNRESLEEGISDAGWQEAFYKKTVLALQTESRFVTYFSQFSPESVETFIKDYASRKTAWHFYNYKYGNLERKRQKRGIEGAVEALRQIQQKKLFDLICRWGNNEISLPGIDITLELVAWNNRIFDCPYLEPVSQSDIDLYLDFLNDLEPEIKLDNCKGVYLGAHDFVHSVKRHNEEWPWSRYYNRALGVKLTLPVHRPLKEEEYYWAAPNQVNYAPNPLPRKPFLSFYNYEDEFVRKFEDARYRKLYAAQKKNTEINSFTADIDMDLIYLSEAQQPVPVAENEDWRIALEDASEGLTRRLVADELPFVFEEYLNRRHKGKSFDKWHIDRKSVFPIPVSVMKEEILAGRMLLGEPADFNY